MTTTELGFERIVRDQALEEAARLADSQRAGSLAATIRARKANPFTPATPAELQRVLGNADVTD